MDDINNPWWSHSTDCTCKTCITAKKYMDIMYSDDFDQNGWNELIYGKTLANKLKENENI